MTTTDRRCRRRAALAAALSLLAAAAVAPAARAADPAGVSPNTISVAGAATVKGKPTTVVIVATLTGEAELAADARVKFEDAKKKAMGILSGLKNPDLTIEGQGSSIEQGGDQNPNRFNGMPQQGNDKPRVRISEQLKLTLANADKLPGEKLMAAVLKTLDATRDAGLQVGPPPPRNYYEAQNQTGGLATFHIADTTPLLDQALSAAVDDARRRAKRLADLNGVKLGPVVSIQEQGGSSASEARIVYYYGNNDNGNPPVTKDVSANTLAEIPVTSKVYVQFEIVK